MRTDQDFKVDFIGIGAAKAGTSWLAKALHVHPDICLTAVKETNFFCREHRSARGAYMQYDGTNLGTYRLFFKRCRPGQLKGEFSVHYLPERRAAEDIHRHFPDIKILAVLREPVSRFISNYRFARYTLGRDTCPLEAQLNPGEKNFRHGLYGENLERYFARFPKKNIKVLIYEEMRADPAAALRDVYSFLGVDPSFIPHELMGKQVNQTKLVRFAPLMRAIGKAQVMMIRLGVEHLVTDAMKKRLIRLVQRVNFAPLNAEPVNDEMKEKIRLLYREDRRKLEGLLGRDLTPLWGP